MRTLTYDQLRDAVDARGVGVRSRTRMAPLGGKGDKVFPPTYATGERASSKYALEKRRVEGEDVDAVVLDSVASQANRFEVALLDAYRRGEVAFPVVSVDFRDTPIAYMDRISSLEASHRIFDALLRDSLLDGVLFRLSEMGRAITEATTRNALALFRYAPTTLVFGGWDSTGPRGGQGAKYERTITSEIVGLGVVPGVKTSSRIDPAGIELKAGPLYLAPDGTWTLEEAEALREKGKPVQLGQRDARERGRPSQANFGNVTPSVDTQAGGVTVDEILATTVLSFIQLRRLRFPVDESGSLLPDNRRQAVETAGRTALAALGLAAAVLAFEDGFDLRSRCVLVPDGELELEMLMRGEPDTAFILDRSQALDLLSESSEAAGALGLSWATEEILLHPAPRLVDLIRRSHDLAARGESDDDA